MEAYFCGAAGTESTASGGIAVVQPATIATSVRMTASF
jgi:hypothetical protein